VGRSAATTLAATGAAGADARGFSAAVVLRTPRVIGPRDSRAARTLGLLFVSAFLTGGMSCCVASATVVGCGSADVAEAVESAAGDAGAESEGAESEGAEFSGVDESAVATPWPMAMAAPTPRVAAPARNHVVLVRRVIAHLR